MFQDNTKGEIRTLAKKNIKILGNLSANSTQLGGKIDITAEKVKLEKTKIEEKVITKEEK